MAKKQVNKRRKFQIPINRFCRFTKAGFKEIDYKDVEILLKNIDESGKIIVIQQIVDDRNEPLILTKLK